MPVAPTMPVMPETVAPAPEMAPEVAPEMPAAPMPAEGEMPA